MKLKSEVSEVQKDESTVWHPGLFAKLGAVAFPKFIKTKLSGLSPRANYTDRATAACRRS
jgi:hypothetical protein